MGKIQLVGKNELDKNIILAESLESEDLLQALVKAGNSSESSESLITRLNSIIAEKILELSLDDGFNLVLPVSELISRNLRHDNDSPKLKSLSDLPKDTLACLYASLENSPDPSRKVHEGLHLGDKALHIFAGMGGSRHFREMAGSEEFKKYNERMAKIGYSTAVNSAKRLNKGEEGIFRYYNSTHN
ncbi:hypothetical protein GF354_02985 [Candidatus Peregrinibacteria bacterium]|nr:hypothetical protein [Candidatus Peregrinibacteria bacterium]